MKMKCAWGYTLSEALDYGYRTQYRQKPVSLLEGLQNRSVVAYAFDNLEVLKVIRDTTTDETVKALADAAITKTLEVSS